MDKIGKKDTDIYFSCSCRDWRISDGDKTNIEPEPAIDYFLNHTCDKIQVWQKKRGMERIFNRK